MRALRFLEIPIVQAPMAGATTPELVAAVSNAGGLGSLPLGFTEPAQIAPLVARVRALTARPFALNLFVDTSPPSSPSVLQRAHDRLRPFRDELGIPHPPVPAVALLDARAQYEAVLAARPAVFSFTFGVPPADVSSAAGRPASSRSAPRTPWRRRSRWSGPGRRGLRAGLRGRRAPRQLRPAGRVLADRDLALVPRSSTRSGCRCSRRAGSATGAASRPCWPWARPRRRSVRRSCAPTRWGLRTPSAACSRPGGSPDQYHHRVLGPHRARRSQRLHGRPGRGRGVAPYPYQHWLTRDIRNAAAQQGRTEYLSMWAGQAVGLGRALPAAAIVAELAADAERAGGPPALRWTAGPPSGRCDPGPLRGSPELADSPSTAAGHGRLAGGGFSMDRTSWSDVKVSDEALRALLSWGERERAISRQLVGERLGYGEFLLRRQLNYDRLISETRAGAA